MFCFFGFCFIFFFFYTNQTEHGIGHGMDHFVHTPAMRVSSISSKADRNKHFIEILMSLVVFLTTNTHKKKQQLDNKTVL